MSKGVRGRNGGGPRLAEQQRVEGRVGSVTDGQPQTASARWLAWNERDRWFVSRVLVIVLGLGLLSAPFVLPAPPDGCEYDPACTDYDRELIMMVAGAGIAMSACAVWAAGRRTVVLWLLEGVTLIVLGYFFVLSVNLGNVTSLPDEPGIITMAVGAVFVVVGTLSALSKGFVRLRNRGV